MRITLSHRHVALRHALYTLLFLMTFSSIFILSACKKETDPTVAAKKGKAGKQLTLLTMDRIKATNYLTHIIPPFEKAYNAKVNVISVDGSEELLKYLQGAKGSQKFDVVVGMDNCMFADPTAFDGMYKTKTLKRFPVNANFQFDPQARLVPYAFGYLAMLYNEQKITDPPTSFGELQDVRFFDQIVVCDPHRSGIGRAVLYWTLALFGNSGYQQFWNSIKKNTYKNKDSWQEAILALNNQECSMAFGFTSTPAWILESQPSPLPIKASLMKEGSYLYVEAAGVNQTSRRKPLAEAFLYYLMAPETQRFVAYDLGLFPANESTPLPANFSTIPFTTFTVNDKLRAENPASNLPDWLAFWTKLFTTGFY